MIAHVLLGVGLVLVVEGLVFALAPSRLEDILEAIAELSVESRRMIGLGAVFAGVVLVWLSKGMLN